MGFSVSHTGGYYSKIQIAEASWLFVISTSEFRNPKAHFYPSWKKIQRKREKHCCFWNKRYRNILKRGHKRILKNCTYKLGAPFHFVRRVSSAATKHWCIITTTAAPILFCLQGVWKCDSSVSKSWLGRDLIWPRRHQNVSYCEHLMRTSKRSCVCEAATTNEMSRRYKHAT